MEMIHVKRVGSVAKLVMTFTVGDGCSWSCDETIPIEYESEEALICDFMDAARDAFYNKKPMVFLNQEWWTEMFIWYSKYPDPVTKKREVIEEPPEIQTLEDWFRLNRIMKINE